MTLLLDTGSNDVNPPDASGVKSPLGRTIKSMDQAEHHDSERDELDRADAERSMVARAIARRQAMPNGEWMIRNIDELRAAVTAFTNPSGDDQLSAVYGPDEIQRHIIQRARDLQLVGLLPQTWGINQETSTQRRKRIMLRAIEDQKDKEFLMTLEELDNAPALLQASRFFSAAIRRKYASRGIALPDGSFPIPDKDALRRAIRLWGKGGQRAKRHIIKRARAMGATGMLPEKWGAGGKKTAAAEDSRELDSLVAEGISLQNYLVLGESSVPKAQLLQDNTTDVGGFARIKVPFYIGDSVSKAPGIKKRIRFPTRILQETVQAAKDQIAKKTQPLNVYSRHAAALSGVHLPVGGIVDAVAEGRIGYVICDIVNEGDGKQAIALMKHEPPLLNAVSLRAGPSKYELEEVELQQESIYEVQKLHLDGVDFAPDSPAMATFGVQFLAAESERESPKNNKVEVSLDRPLTLEVLRADHPALIEELLAPLLDEKDTLMQENGVLKGKIKVFEDKEKRSALNDYVAEIAGFIPEKQRDEARKLFQEMADGSKDKAEFSIKAMPYLTRILATGSLTEKPAMSMEDRFSKLFPTGGGNGHVNGATLEQESVEGSTTEKDNAVQDEFAVPV